MSSRFNKNEILFGPTWTGVESHWRAGELVRELVRYQFLYQSNVPVFPVENCRFGTGTSVFNKEKINIYFSSLLKPMYQFQNGSFQRRKLAHWTGTRTGTVPVHVPVQVWLTGPAAAAVMSARIGFRFCSRVHQRLPWLLKFRNLDLDRSEDPPLPPRTMLPNRNRASARPILWKISKLRREILFAKRGVFFIFNIVLGGRVFAPVSKKNF